MAILIQQTNAFSRAEMEQDINETGLLAVFKAAVLQLENNQQCSSSSTQTSGVIKDIGDVCGAKDVTEAEKSSIIPASKPVAYQLSQNITNVKDCWMKYTIGLNGNPSIRSLESLGNSWRQDNGRSLEIWASQFLMACQYNSPRQYNTQSLSDEWYQYPYFYLANL
ncbi:hypothetical protein BC833DRAFT_564878 [Globomyces pollinis-pini]|nr:hypothetical protein BC833DRAFT_564878 [Globomyces pollinis-pini]